MLTLPKKIHLQIPSIITTQPMVFSTLVDDEDELTQAIVATPVEHDNNWTLEEAPDEERLTKFWSEVEDDVRHDPQWFTFAEE